MFDTETANLLWVCVCCVRELANHDTSGCRDSCAPDHHTTLFSRVDDDHCVTLGMLRSEHRDGCTAEDCECETISFSSRTCDGCGSPLAGERFAATEWIPEDPR